MRRKRIRKTAIYMMLALVVAFAIFTIVLPNVFSNSLAIVRSSSMSPAMPAGSLAVVSPVEPAGIKIGDIIAFNPPWDRDVTVSHRVVEILDNGFVTKGDAAEDEDRYIIQAQNVVGRLWWHIPYIGYALNDIRRFASTFWGFCLLVILPSLVIFFSAMRDVHFAYSPGRRRERLLKKRTDLLKARRPRALLARRSA